MLANVSLDQLLKWTIIAGLVVTMMLGVVAIVGGLSGWAGQALALTSPSWTGLQGDHESPMSIAWRMLALLTPWETGGPTIIVIVVALAGGLGVFLPAWVALVVVRRVLT